VALRLYQEIAESIRQAIFSGELKPGDELPSVRDLSAQWNCAPGTVQQAYHELARQGLVTGRSGQGTRVAAAVPPMSANPLRQVGLANEIEAFLLRLLANGYSLPEVEQAIRLVSDRWRTMARETPVPSTDSIRFVGSHDPSISILADWLKKEFPSHSLQISFAGSLGGLIALSENKADMAGCHLWDQETDTYNSAFVRRLLPGQRTALLTLAHRRLGIIVPAGNPAGIQTLADLTQPQVRFINRQSGAGTRVWLDAQLSRWQLDCKQIVGYDDEVMTHTEVARTIAEGRANVGLGIETAATAYGLDFLFLTNERYDLIIPEAVLASEPVQHLAIWLRTEESHALLNAMKGYDTSETGQLLWTP
jgi:putative molybdopterin biosynthesis protein